MDSLKKSINKADDDNAFNGENGDKLNGTGTESTQDRLIHTTKNFNLHNLDSIRYVAFYTVILCCRRK